MHEPAARGRVARLLAVLTVLLGLLAMHGVASPHHAAAAAIPVADHAAVPVIEEPVAETAHLHDRPAVQHDAAVRLDAAGPAGPAGPSCHGECPSDAALCVAVLAGAALALLLARGRAVPLLLAPAHPRACVPAPSVRRVRGPDPVRELCVSRT